MRLNSKIGQLIEFIRMPVEFSEKSIAAKDYPTKKNRSDCNTLTYIAILIN